MTMNRLEIGQLVFMSHGRGILISANLKQVPLGQAPFLHHLHRSMARISPVEESLFNGFSGTMGLSDCSEAFMLGLRPPALPSRTDSGTLHQSLPSSPGSRPWSVYTCLRPLTPGN